METHEEPDAKGNGSVEEQPDSEPSEPKAAKAQSKSKESKSKDADKKPKRLSVELRSVSQTYHRGDEPIHVLDELDLAPPGQLDDPCSRFVSDDDGGCAGVEQRRDLRRGGGTAADDDAAPPGDLERQGEGEPHGQPLRSRPPEATHWPSGDATTAAIRLA